MKIEVIRIRAVAEYLVRDENGEVTGIEAAPPALLWRSNALKGFANYLNCLEECDGAQFYERTSGGKEEPPRTRSGACGSE